MDSNENYEVLRAVSSHLLFLVYHRLKVQNKIHENRETSLWLR